MEDMPLWLKVTTALFLGFMAWRLWPVARHWSKEGPKGSADDWRAAIVPLALVVLLIALLVAWLRGQ